MARSAGKLSDKHTVILAKARTHYHRLEFDEEQIYNQPATFIDHAVWVLAFAMTTALRRQIRYHRIEHRKSGPRDAQAAIGIDDDRALLAQDGNAALIE